MRIDPTNHNAPQLRLIKAVESAPVVTPVKPTRPASAVSGDSLSFESVYIQRLPRVPITDAHRRLERIRQQLVGATTDVPMHFDTPAASRSANPYQAAYLKLSASPGEFNASATQAKAAAE